MRRFGLRSWSWLVLGIPLCLGCGGGAETAQGPEEAAEETTAEEPTTGIKRVAAAKLPPLSDSLPTLDGGRIANLAPPKGWEPLQRDNKHVARFTTNKSNPNDLPRILVTADPATDFTDDVTADNVAAFAEALAAGKKFLEPPKPLIIGDNAYARYVTQAKKGTRVVERQFLETVFDGRHYAIVLEVYGEQLPKSRDFAYAIAAGIQYTNPAGNAPAPAPMAEETKAE